MGLDMHLEAELYATNGWQPEGAPKGQLDGIYATFGPASEGWRERYPESSSAYVFFKVGYWRKANAIHGWFVENVQGGVDNCERHRVSREKLEELRAVCAEVLEASPFDADLAAAKLPRRKGFFFGGDSYDEWYLEDLRETVRQIDVALADPMFEDAEFYYRSSW